ncbi:hypothetical protein OfM1_19230 [Lactovum odontotermitis]
METWSEKAERISADVYFYNPDEYDIPETIEGWAIYDEKRKIKVAFVNNARSPKMIRNIALHELEHLENEDSTFSFSMTTSKMESKANLFMVEEQAEDYVVNYGDIYEDSCIDVNDFLDSYELSRNFYEIAQKILFEKFGKKLQLGY